MKVIKTIQEIRKTLAPLKKKGKSIGFIPTMGALHEGHLSLARQSLKENNLTILSIFVNPAQFGKNEDFAAYPRPEKKDINFAKQEKVDIIFYPSVVEMYREGSSTSISVDKITEGLCGKFRPGHFEGVATVVGKLLNIIGPDVMYLGQKDAQQCVVLKKVVDDLNFPVRIRVCQTVREHDGLAMSSRNAYLNLKERREAPIIFQSLKMARDKIRSGERNVKTIRKIILENIKAKSSGDVQYIECVQADNLEPLTTLEGKVMIALSVWFGKTRLIDNIIFHVN